MYGRAGEVLGTVIGWLGGMHMQGLVERADAEL